MYYRKLVALEREAREVRKSLTDGIGPRNAVVAGISGAVSCPFLQVFQVSVRRDSKQGWPSSKNYNLTLQKKRQFALVLLAAPNSQVTFHGAVEFLCFRIHFNLIKVTHLL